MLVIELVRLQRALGIQLPIRLNLAFQLSRYWAHGNGCGKLHEVSRSNLTLLNGKQVEVLLSGRSRGYNDYYTRGLGMV